MPAPPRFPRLRSLAYSLLSGGVAALCPIALDAQGAPASGGLSIRVTVLEPVRPIALTNPAEPPRLSRNERTGQLSLALSLTSAGGLDATVTDARGTRAVPLGPQPAREDGRAADAAGSAWLVPLAPAQADHEGATEVRFTSRTGEAETVAIALIPAALLRTTLAARPGLPDRDTRQLARDARLE